MCAIVLCRGFEEGGWTSHQTELGQPLSKRGRPGHEQPSGVPPSLPASTTPTHMQHATTTGHRLSLHSCQQQQGDLAYMPLSEAAAPPMPLNAASLVGCGTWLLGSGDVQRCQAATHSLPPAGFPVHIAGHGNLVTEPYTSTAKAMNQTAAGFGIGMAVPPLRIQPAPAPQPSLWAKGCNAASTQAATWSHGGLHQQQPLQQSTTPSCLGRGHGAGTVGGMAKGHVTAAQPAAAPVNRALVPQSGVDVCGMPVLELGRAQIGVYGGRRSMRRVEGGACQDTFGGGLVAGEDQSFSISNSGRVTIHDSSFVGGSSSDSSSSSDSDDDNTGDGDEYD